jgi:branched-chain amino acid aminotransferase
LTDITYINIDGSLFDSSKPIFTIDNRAFKYGDALFETIRVIDGTPQLLEDHFIRLRKGMKILKMRFGLISFNELKMQILSLIEKNGILKGGRIRLTVYRTGGGLYAPHNEGKSFVIEATPIKENRYELNENGLFIDLYKDFKLGRNILSPIKTTNSIPYILTGIFKNEMGLDDCLILNDQGRIVEALSSNIFLYKNNNIYTPSLEEGCIDGVMRRQVLKIAKDMGINVFEGMLNGSMMLQADEMFLTNSIKGIQWVAQYVEKRYSNDKIKDIIENLNASIQ